MESDELPPYFADKIASIIVRLYPESNVEIINDELVRVDGRNLQIINLYRLAMEHGSIDNVDEKIERYLSKILSFKAINTSNIDVVREHIFPRIHPLDTVKQLADEAAYQIFSNNTAICYVIDMPDIMISIPSNQINAWGLDIEEIDELARKNLIRETPDFQPNIVHTFDGGNIALIHSNDGYDSSRLLLPSLYEDVSQFLKGDFYAAIPARDLFYCFSKTPANMANRLFEQIKKDFSIRAYPISPKPYFVTLDGIVGD